MEEAVILAGGLGTRIRGVLKDTPKSLAEIGGKPFLYYILKKIVNSPLKHVVIAANENAYKVREYFGDFFEGIKLTYSIEKMPLGTGGAVMKAARFIEEKNFFVINGDTFFDIELKDMALFHKSKQSLLTIALKSVSCAERYGIVETSSTGKIYGFKEKMTKNGGFINGGIYLVNKDFLLSFQNELPQKFSFEKQFLEKYAGKGIFYGYASEGYFIDIGVPDDFEVARKEVPYINSFEKAVFKIRQLKPNKEWTLFLDRDGTINRRIEGDYVRKPEDFVFLPGIFDFLKEAQKYFGLTIIVTNQRGIGRKLMSEKDLDSIHRKMLEEFGKRGIKIDGIYFCPHDPEKESCSCRKPLPGLAFQAKSRFPQIDFTKSVMVGDSDIDEEFAKNAGMKFIKI